MVSHGIMTLQQTRIIAANSCRNLACETAGFYLIVIGIFKLESKYVCTKHQENNILIHLIHLIETTREGRVT